MKWNSDVYDEFELVYEKIDGTQTMGTDKEKWTLELCVPLGGKKGLIQIDMFPCTHRP